MFLQRFAKVKVRVLRLFKVKYHRMGVLYKNSIVLLAIDDDLLVIGIKIVQSIYFVMMKLEDSCYFLSKLCIVEIFIGGGFVPIFLVNFELDFDGFSCTLL